MSAIELSEQISENNISPIEIIDTYINRIQDKNHRTNSYITILEKQAREKAVEAELAVERGEELPPLHGVPVAIKDLAPMAGVRTTFGSKLFEDNIAETTAILIKRLRSAGAIPIGKTNACEFGHKGTTDNSIVGATSTPFDLNRNAGGSSGGSAAAVADRLSPLAHGGDGGGSIRIPAACCGVYGLNPSYGRVPNETRPDAFNEHTPFVRRGPLTRTVADAAVMLDVIAGPHPSDPFSLPERNTGYISAVDRPIDNLSVVYTPDLGIFPLDEQIREVLDKAIDALGNSGADIVRMDPPFDYSLRAIFDAWETTWQMTYAGLAEGFRINGTNFIENLDDLSPDFADIVEAGMNLTITEIKRANRIRTSVMDTVQTVHEDHDLIATSTLTRPPVQNAAETIGPQRVNGQFVGSPIGWCLTYPFNLIPNPSASVPAGVDSDGLPVGMQLIGRKFADDTVLAASGAIERERPWRQYYDNV